KNGNLCYVLPGVPREMTYIMENSVLPYLQQQVKDNVILHYTWRTTGVPESKLAEMLGDINKIEKYGKLAFLPKFTGVDVRISITANNQQEAENLRQAADELVLDKAGKFVYATGDMPLEQVVGDLLRERNETLAVAESCTGGLICHQITSIAGNSDYFMGGMITYSNDQKIKALGVSELTLEKFGAVSEDMAKEMAAMVRDRVGTDYGLSVTGIAGPGGGTNDKPVGLVYIGLATNNGVRVKKFLFAKDRASNQERSAAAALLMLLLELKGSM
ncbi:MAG: nicotinamide-nucleotide amidohydrolase family protein, partial [bacterium]